MERFEPFINGDIMNDRTDNRLRERSFDYNDKQAEQQYKRQEKRRDITELLDQPPKDAKRKAKAQKSLLFFLQTYFKEFFTLEFSPAHLDVIKTIQESIERGENYCLAMPRSFGKTLIGVLSILWGISNGLIKFGVIVAMSGRRATDLIDDIIRTLIFNELLGEDFPELVTPLRQSNGNSRRLASLEYKGQPLSAEMRRGFYYTGRTPGKCSESVLTAVGIGGSIRGLSLMTSKGKIRPDFVLLDDPQDRESAQSQIQTDSKERVINSDIAGLAGVDGKFTILCCCTVIEKNDLADRFLNRELHPEFKGKIYKMLETMPNQSALELWKQYGDIRALEFRTGGNGQKARQFYLDNYDAMNEGAKVTWTSRKGKDDVDSLEYCMKLYLFQGKEAFFSEYQNEPITRDASTSPFNAEQIEIMCKGTRQFVAPCDRNEHLTAFIDCHKNLFYYAVCSWGESLNGAIIDYGTFPRQKRRVFSLRDASPTIQSSFPTLPFEKAFAAALSETIEQIFNCEYLDENGNTLKIDRLGVDANWGETTDLVYSTIAASRYSKQIFPTHGKFFGAKTPFNLKAKGGKLGLNWGVFKSDKTLKRIVYDTNFWKTTLFSRLCSSVEVDRLSIFGEPYEHYLLVNHLRAESPITVEAGGRRVDEWTLNKERQDNHWLDCLTGCCMLANYEGCVIPGEDRKAKAKHKLFNDVQKINRNNFDF